MTKRLSRILYAGGRRHLPFIVVVPILLVVMTNPAVPHLLDGSTWSFPSRNTDVWMKIWDAWHLKRALAGETALFHSDALFYPEGLSLAFQNFSLPHMFALAGLQTWMSLSSAYNLAYLLIVSSVAASAYICINYLLRDRWLALLGAVVVAFSQHVVSHPQHPDLNLIVALPLALLFFQRSLDEGRWRWVAACGLVMGFSAFMSVYIFVCVVIAMSVYGLGSAFTRWRSGRFWLISLAIGLIAVLAAAPRLYPMLAPSANLEGALEKNEGVEGGNELLAYFVPYHHPVLRPLFTEHLGANPHTPLPQTSYLGFVPLALIGFGLYRARYRGPILFWLLMALPFLLLRLGSALRLDNVVYENIALPKALLDQLLPAVFQPFHQTDHFQMGVLLPLALMTCYGFKSLNWAGAGRRRPAFALAVIALIAFEYYGGLATRVVPARQLAFIDWLAEQPDQDAIRLINLPMGRLPSKDYGFYQALSAYPHAEGLTGRTDPGAYRAIDGNLLPRSWRNHQSVHCTPLNRESYGEALARLRADGFSHIVLHRGLGRYDRVASGFIDAPIAYADDFATIYRLADLGEACGNASLLGPAFLARAEGDWRENLVLPEPSQAALLSLHPVSSAEGETTATYSAALLSQNHLSLWNSDDLDGREQDLAQFGLILLVHDPRDTDAATLHRYREWVDGRFAHCDRLLDAADTVLDLYIRADYPCELALDGSPLGIRYDGGPAIANIAYRREGERVEVTMMWDALPRQARSYSLQLLDSGGQRAAGADDTFQHEAFTGGSVDLSGLPAGEYGLHLIVYDFESGASFPGALTATGQRIERALEIATIGVD